MTAAAAGQAVLSRAADGSAAAGGGASSPARRSTAAPLKPGFPCGGPFSPKRWSWTWAISKGIGPVSAITSAVDGVEAMQVYYSKYLPGYFTAWQPLSTSSGGWARCPFLPAAVLFLVSLALLPVNNLFRGHIEKLKSGLLGLHGGPDRHLSGECPGAEYLQALWQGRGPGSGLLEEVPGLQPQR